MTTPPKSQPDQAPAGADAHQLSNVAACVGLLGIGSLINLALMVLQLSLGLLAIRTLMIPLLVLAIIAHRGLSRLGLIANSAYFVYAGAVFMLVARFATVETYRAFIIVMLIELALQAAAAWAAWLERQRLKRWLAQLPAQATVYHVGKAPDDQNRD